jgi:general secretion pathway protein D
VFLTNVPALFYRLLKQDTNTRTLANPNCVRRKACRAGQVWRARAGAGHDVLADRDRGVSQQPITSFNYENIGVNIDITPRTHHDDEVSLALKIEVSNISGAGFGGLPTFGNRYISTVIRCTMARPTCWRV